MSIATYWSIHKVSAMVYYIFEYVYKYKTVKIVYGTYVVGILYISRKNKLCLAVLKFNKNK